MQTEEIFLAVVERKDPAERTAFLNKACGDDDVLRANVEALLKSHEEAGSFLDQDVFEPAPTVNQPLSEKPGDTIGPYKLLQKIGEGGFGVVYMAEQTQPVRRKVAIKVIKPGMDTKEVIARFEAERQALALMDHAFIARVYDAGATESGRPYFVMELVKGVPLTEYCDRNHLATSQRLKLFVDVCHAVQHAHQKGVIHRDLKPSNIMVTLHDGKPVPKVIDFGVSKALSQQLTEKTLFTAYGQMVGTPAYMSPEQAEMSGLDVDTRCDVYSLGVLLYELLTGRTPFDAARLRKAGYAEMQRIIREEEPLKPSTKLTTMSEESDVVSSNRGTNPKRLGQMVRGDLDWIVMKALEKERDRRYETANGFAADIQRYLSDAPVEACPPSAGYQLRKFARRNKAVIATTAAVALSLIIGSSVAVWQAVRATQQRDRAVEAELLAEGRLASELKERRRAEQAEKTAAAEASRADAAAKLARNEADIATVVKDFLLKDLLAQADVEAQLGGEFARDPNIKVRTLLDRASHAIADRFEDQPLVEAEIRGTIGRAYSQLGTYQRAESQLKRAYELYLQELGSDAFPTLQAQHSLAVILFETDRDKESLAMHQEVLDRQMRTLGPEHRSTLLTQTSIAIRHNRMGRHDEALELQKRVLETYRRVRGAEDPYALYSEYLVAACYHLRGDEAKALKLLSKTVDTQKRVCGATHPDTLEMQCWLAKVHAKLGNTAEAMALYRQTMIVSRKVLGPEHVATRKVSLALAKMLVKFGDINAAITVYRELLKHHPENGLVYRDLGEALRRIGKVEESILAFEKANQFAESAQSENRINHGQALLDGGETDMAIDAFVVSFEHFVKELQQKPKRANQQNLAVACVKLAQTLREQGQTAEAVRYFERADKLGVNHRFFYVEYALCHRSLGNEAEYEQACDKLIALFPEPSQRKAADWGHLAQHLYKVGKYEDALQGLERTIKARGDAGPSLKSGPRWWYYTLTLCRLEQTDMAREHYDQLAQLMKDDPPGNLKLNLDLQSEAAELLGLELSQTDSLVSKDHEQP